jgi:predicted ATP-grasp superfamily ATP-dependent carboligase
VDDINGKGLIPNLIALRLQVCPDERPVLFLTNDRMVRIVANHLDAITPHYRLSWAPSARVVAELLEKSAIQPRCESSGLNYPKSAQLSGLEDMALAAGFEWPRIAKPVRPLSGFKVQVLDTPQAAREFLSRHLENMPILLQEWIPGGDERIYFNAGYYDQGKPLVTFGGRKLRSFPMGHTTVAEPLRDEEVERCAARFFAETGISGPASLELKRDSGGRLWVIEPTVGRTDFWLDLCIQNGVNLPFLEYLHQTGQPLPETVQNDRVAWLNCERDPLALPWFLAHPHWLRSRIRRLRFTYLTLADLRPFWSALRVQAQTFQARLGQFFSKAFLHVTLASLIDLSEYDIYLINSIGLT